MLGLLLFSNSVFYSAVTVWLLELVALRCVALLMTVRAGVARLAPELMQPPLYLAASQHQGIPLQVSYEAFSTSQLHNHQLTLDGRTEASKLSGADKDPSRAVVASCPP